MKRILAVIFVLSLSLTADAQKKITPQDSIKIFYDNLFSTLKSGYLHKQTINWKLIESQTEQDLRQYNTFQSSLLEIKKLFDKIGATHCNVYYKQNKYSATVKNILKEDYSEQWKKKYDTKPAFEVKVINEKYGYILIPAMLSFDIGAKNIHNIAQPLYNKIAAFKAENNIEGWIIDLRFNIGGNSWPMLLALYDFLGDNDIGGSLNEDKKQESKLRLDKGKLIEKSKMVSFINPIGELLDKKKVSILTGIFTASSGEVVALAFKGRPNTNFIGENTYGATTGNIACKLPFNITMALTTSYDSDRNGNYYEKIVPDIRVSKQDNFDNLSLDKNIQQGIEFIDKKE
ncbi:S41 family peptidase [Pedobacter jejuensis]|uniref:Peptidase S41 protein n=1 Tax=Pedobacter jejuensis TaxID=1268550 RepID=A0A3N0BWK6_9SPHI|nr:S41 family peptidase [Pedobacter jejuensis]RNL54099.1 peptidase S41 protein [Pedobacter jejuensis]